MLQDIYVYEYVPENLLYHLLSYVTCASSLHQSSLTFTYSFTQAGANVNVSAGGATPLHIAADIGNSDIINCLLKAGADPNVTDEVWLWLIMHSPGFENFSIFLSFSNFISWMPYDTR